MPRRPGRRRSKAKEEAGKTNDPLPHPALGQMVSQPCPGGPEGPMNPTRAVRASPPGIESVAKLCRDVARSFPDADFSPSGLTARGAVFFCPVAMLVSRGGRCMDERLEAGRHHLTNGSRALDQ